LNRRESFLYVSRFFTGFAGWLVFLAVALMVKEAYGAERVPLTFLFQGMPPLLLSNWLARLTPEHKMKSIFIVAQLIGILALSFLQPDFGMIGILLFIVVNSTIQTLTNPILISLAMHTVDSNRWQAVHTRLSSVQASTLAIAPIFGGWFSMTFGFANLIWLTAACGLIGAAMMVPAIPPLQKTDKPVEGLRWFQQWRPLTIPSKILRRSILVWSLFLVCGAFLNVIEFPMFEIQGLNRGKIGWMLGAWGVGNLTTFFAGSRKIVCLSLTWSAAFFTAALALFVVSNRLEPALLAFLLGGFLNSYIAGILRNNITQAIPEQVRSLDVWAAVNQRMSIINISIYGMGGYLLTWTSPRLLGSAMIACGLVLFTALRYPKMINGR
jgi:hypothetical protein